MVTQFTPSEKCRVGRCRSDGAKGASRSRYRRMSGPSRNDIVIRIPLRARHLRLDTAASGRRSGSVHTSRDCALGTTSAKPMWPRRLHPHALQELGTELQTLQTPGEAQDLIGVQIPPLDPDRDAWKAEPDLDELRPVPVLPPFEVGLRAASDQTPLSHVSSRCGRVRPASRCLRLPPEASGKLGKLSGIAHGVEPPHTRFAMRSVKLL